MLNFTVSGTFDWPYKCYSSAKSAVKYDHGSNLEGKTNQGCGIYMCRTLISELPSIGINWVELQQFQLNKTETKIILFRMYISTLQCQE